MDHIILVAQQLAKEGKKPNTATIKARLPKNTPLPSIIQALKLWQSDPHKEIKLAIDTSEAATPETNNSDIDELIEHKIAQAIAPLKAQIIALNEQLNSLKEQLNSHSEMPPNKQED